MNLHPAPPPTGLMPTPATPVGQRPQQVTARPVQAPEAAEAASRQSRGQATIHERRPNRREDEDAESQPTAEEERAVQTLKARDQEVRQHEAMHRAAGREYVRGATRFSYENGPDGQRYATGGEVEIDTSKPGDPDQALSKARTLRAAALAPAAPSAQDRSVAAQASRMEAEARQEQLRQRSEGQTDTDPDPTLGRRIDLYA
ncbi:putative metalloprotease CJM1_0395 family protein [Thiohalobacter sp. IOR34]|uniref:putative metalloprotease CJM1_0395 family protein n=1 Tax=Thiohalobacter sp. IOR34 TaxID=3057176 RepID=UPI0025AFC750|nr:putative metalloprotease CJM1_0395 family protein [Thiohalobacter sp. IOR34]WJW75420.1 putative metalloprotease CJM1_0395 family protein [Thiohalobacter sp. IOR34]